MNVTFASSVQIERPRDVVVAIATDHTLAPEVDERVSHVESNGRPHNTVGFAVTVYPKDGVPATPFTTTTVRAALPDELVDETVHPTFRLRTHTLFVELEPDLTLMAAHMTITLPWYRFLHAWLLKLTAGTQAQQDAEKLKAFIESRT